MITESLWTGDNSDLFRKGATMRSENEVRSVVDRLGQEDCSEPGVRSFEARPMDDQIDPWEIEPLHGVRNKSLLLSLTTDMNQRGWKGRPLLVIERSRPETRYLAWTGSHRIAAAREAELASVSCYVIHEDKLSLFDVDAKFGHCDDTDRLRILRKVGDEVAIGLMLKEGRA
jgi:ParB-like nuclease domain